VRQRTSIPDEVLDGKTGNDADDVEKMDTEPDTRSRMTVNESAEGEHKSNSAADYAVTNIGQAETE
jgi:hypothetical protein